VQVLLIILIAIILLPIPGAAREGSPWLAVGIAWGVTALILLVSAMVCLWLRIRMRRGDVTALRRAETVLRTQQWLVVVAMAVAVIGFGWVDVVRDLSGDLLILDEILAILPALVAFAVAWWIFYPFEKSVREALLVRDLDEGRVVVAPPSRMHWVLQQVRSNLLLLLVPILLVATAADTGRRLADLAGAADHPWMGTMAGIAAAIPMVFLAPWVVVKLLDTSPLPAGALRSEMEEACRTTGVRVRDLMLWKTGGTLVNGAVTGFLPSARWVLLSDGLVERLRRQELLAVLGHELAHVSKRHMFWLAASLLAISLALGAGLDPLFVFLQEAIYVEGGDFQDLTRRMEWLNAAAVGVVLLGTLLGFGWVSRRFERQADAFAAVHLSRQAGGEQVQLVMPEAVQAMRSALGSVAAFNGVDPARHSWRHGSIRWRQRQLDTIRGMPIDHLPVDATVNWIKITSAVLIIAGIVFFVLASGTGVE